MASQPAETKEEGQILSKKLVGGYLYKLVGVPKPSDSNLRRDSTSSVPETIPVTQSSAGPSQFCGTSGYTLPAHTLGRQVAEQQTGASVKPRLGVKLPTLNLSSPILSREELYEEVTKRSTAQSAISRNSALSLNASSTTRSSHLTNPKVTVSKSKSLPKQRPGQSEPQGPVKKKKLNTVVVVFNQTRTPEQRTFMADHLYACSSALDGKMAQSGTTVKNVVPKRTSNSSSPTESLEDAVVLLGAESLHNDVVTEGEEYAIEVEIPTSELVEHRLADINAANGSDRMEDVEAAMAALHGEESEEEHPKTTEPSFSSTNAECQTHILNPNASIGSIVSTETVSCSEDVEMPLGDSENANTSEGPVLVAADTEPGLSGTPTIGKGVALPTACPLEPTDNSDAQSKTSLSGVSKSQAEEKLTKARRTPPSTAAPTQSAKPLQHPATATTSLLTTTPSHAVVNTPYTDSETVKETPSVAEAETKSPEKVAGESDVEILEETSVRSIRQRVAAKAGLRSAGPPENAGSPRKTSSILRRKKRKLTGTRFARKSEGLSGNKPKFSRDLSNLFSDEGVINMLNASQAPTGRRRSAPSDISGGLNALPTNLLSKGCLNAIQRVTKTLRRKSSSRIEKTSQIAKPRRKPVATSRAKTEVEDKVIQQWEALPAPGSKNGHVVYVPKKKARSATSTPNVVRRKSCTSEESPDPQSNPTRKSKISIDTIVEKDKPSTLTVSCDDESQIMKKRGKRKTLDTAPDIANKEEMEVLVSPRKKGPSLLAGLEKREKERSLSSTVPFAVPGTSFSTNDFVLPPVSPDKGLTRVLNNLEHEEQQKAKRRLMSLGTKYEEDHVGGLRTSLRQTEGSFHYKEIILRKHDNFVHILLNPTSTTLKNSFNVQVLKEFREAIQSLNKDPTCKVVLVTSHGSVFCQGIDLHALIQPVPEKRKKVAEETATALKEFLVALAQFSKPLVAGVNGTAVGLGVTMLPLFDVVWVSEKATFYTPYSKLGQVPEGAVSLTFYQQLRQSLTSVLLYEGRSVTATEALHQGLANDILWPSKFQEELLPRVQLMANQSSQAMEATKALLRHPLRSRLEAVLNGECRLLVQHWTSLEGQRLMKTFLESENVVL